MMESKGYEVRVMSSDSMVSYGTDAVVWIGHSKGTGKLLLAPPAVTRVALETLSYHDGPKHYVLSESDVQAIAALPDYSGVRFAGGKFGLESSDIQVDYMNRHADGVDWSNADERAGYFVPLAERMIGLGLRGGNFTMFSNTVAKYGKGIEDSFKAMFRHPTSTILKQYASEVPHLMMYPTSGSMEVDRVRKIKLK